RILVMGLTHGPVRFGAREAKPLERYEVSLVDRNGNPRQSTVSISQGRECSTGDAGGVRYGWAKVALSPRVKCDGPGRREYPDPRQLLSPQHVEDRPYPLPLRWLLRRAADG